MFFIKKKLSLLASIISVLLVSSIFAMSDGYRHWQSERRSGVIGYSMDDGQMHYGYDDVHNVYQLETPSEGKLETACGQAALFYAHALANKLEQNPYASYLMLTGTFYTDYDPSQNYLENCIKPNNFESGLEYCRQVCQQTGIELKDWLSDEHMMNCLQDEHLFEQSVRNKLHYATMGVEEAISRIKDNKQNYAIFVTPQRLGLFHHLITLGVRKVGVDCGPFELIIAEGMRWEMLEDLGSFDIDNSYTVNYFYNKFIYPENKKIFKIWLDQLVQDLASDKVDKDLADVLHQILEPMFKQASDQDDLNFELWLQNRAEIFQTNYVQTPRENFLTDPLEQDEFYKKLHLCWTVWAQRRSAHHSQLIEVKVPTATGRKGEDFSDECCYCYEQFDMQDCWPSVLPCGVIGLHTIMCRECLNGHALPKAVTAQIGEQNNCGICGGYVSKEFKEVFEKYAFTGNLRRKFLFSVACARYHSPAEELRFLDKYFRGYSIISGEENALIDEMVKEIAVAQLLENLPINIVFGPCELQSFIRGSNITAWLGEKSAERAICLRSGASLQKCQKYILKAVRANLAAQSENQIARGVVAHIFAGLAGFDIEKVPQITAAIILIRLAQLGAEEKELKQAVPHLEGVLGGMEYLISLGGERLQGLKINMTEEELKRIQIDVIFELIRRNLLGELEIMKNQLIRTNDLLNIVQRERLIVIQAELNSLPLFLQQDVQSVIYVVRERGLFYELINICNQLCLYSMNSSIIYKPLTEEQEERLLQIPGEIEQLPEDLRGAVRKWFSIVYQMFYFSRNRLICDLRAINNQLVEHENLLTAEQEARLEQIRGEIEHLPEDLRRDVRKELSLVYQNRLLVELRAINNQLVEHENLLTAEQEARLELIPAEIEQLPEVLRPKVQEELGKISQNRLICESIQEFQRVPKRAHDDSDEDGELVDEIISDDECGDGFDCGSPPQKFQRI